MNAWQIIGSLIAVVAVIVAVRMMGLGEASIADAAEACDLAEAMVPGFIAREAVICGAGRGALIAGTNGEFVILKRLGSQYAARRLAAPVTTQLRDETVLHIESGDRWFGKINLSFPDEATRAAWRERLDQAR
ncbi:MAG: hypothetical protein GW859_02500 [Sphingomonadales bacterium]|nr:hypothetical protein [Sphingomonadales bacterium]